MKPLLLSIIAIAGIIFTGIFFSSVHAYNSTSTDYGNLSALNQDPSMPKITSNGPLPVPSDIRDRMFDWCLAPRNDLGTIDPKILQFVLENNPKALDNVHDIDTENQVVNEQYWNILQTKLITNNMEFKSLYGNESSIQYLSAITLTSCPPITTTNGTFTTLYNESYNFLLNFDANTFSYTFSKSPLPAYSIQTNSSETEKNGLIIPRIDSPLKQFKSGISVEDIQCADGLTLVVKTEDGTPACVKPDTAQILIERGWGMNISSNTDTDTADDGILSGNVVLAGGPGGPQANYEVDVYATDGITIVGKTFSDINAHYSIPLPAGKYIIYVQDYPKPIQHLVSVFKGKTTTFDILYCTNCK
ncbi:MAG: hypothetical protein ACREBI_07800 [Nitrosotalea sp.]